MLQSTLTFLCPHITYLLIYNKNTASKLLLLLLLLPPLDRYVLPLLYSITTIITITTTTTTTTILLQIITTTTTPLLLLQVVPVILEEETSRYCPPVDADSRRRSDLRSRIRKDLLTAAGIIVGPNCTDLAKSRFFVELETDLTPDEGARR